MYSANRHSYINAFHQLRYVGCYFAAIAVGTVGCGDGLPSVTPVEGKVLLNGKPFTTGRVMTMPDAGRGAGGEIRPDGTFVLTTFNDGDGALPGIHKAAVRAYENPNVTDPEADLGKSLVPKRYTNPITSGLTIEVKPEGENAPVLELKDP